jgi:hypothetical protein
MLVKTSPTELRFDLNGRLPVELAYPESMLSRRPEALLRLQNRASHKQRVSTERGQHSQVLGGLISLDNGSKFSAREVALTIDLESFEVRLFRDSIPSLRGSSKRSFKQQDVEDHGWGRWPQAHQLRTAIRLSGRPVCTSSQGLCISARQEQGAAFLKPVLYYGSEIAIRNIDSMSAAWNLSETLGSHIIVFCSPGVLLVPCVQDDNITCLYSERASS